MPFLIRPAKHSDADYLHELASSLWATGFLTLPADRPSLDALITLSEKSVTGKTAWLPSRAVASAVPREAAKPDEGKYLFVMEDLRSRKVIGSSLVIARHGTPESPHLYFQVDPEKQTLNFQSEETGRTELGGLILDPAYRGHKAKLGKALSLIRFVYMKRNKDKFCDELIAELLPPFTPEGKSYLWECLGRRLTGMDYRAADAKAKKDKRFVLSLFPRGPINIGSLTEDAQTAIGLVGHATEPVVKILTAIGFHYLNQIDPFDGGPHYGAKWEEIRFDVIDEFFLNQEEERELRWTFTPL